MENRIVNYFRDRGFSVNQSEEYTIWASLEAPNGFTLQFVYFKDNHTLYCRLLHCVVNKDVFDGFIVNELKEVDYLFNNNKHIKAFYLEYVK